jgi:hypothetical protein
MVRISLAICFVLCWISCFSVQAANLLIGSLTVKGTSLNQAALIQRLGVAPGQSVAASELQAAADRLIHTGLFTSVNYRYDYSAAQHSYSVVFSVEEPGEFSAVRLDLGGVDEAALWAYLETHGPAYHKKAPPAAEAQDRYARTVEQYLSSIGRPMPVVLKSFSASLSEGAMSAVVIQAKNLPRVHTIAIHGATRISNGRIRQIQQSLAGMEYSHLTFPTALLASLSVDCEDLGLLQPKVEDVHVITGSAQSVDLDATIAEGPVYHFGTIEVTDVPDLDEKLTGTFSRLTGKVASMRDFMRLALTLDRDLESRGLTVSRGYETELNQQQCTLSLHVHVRHKKT